MARNIIVLLLLLWVGWAAIPDAQAGSGGNACCETYEEENYEPEEGWVWCFNGQAMEQCHYIVQQFQYSARCPDTQCVTTGAAPPHTACGGYYVAAKKSWVFTDCSPECEAHLKTIWGCTGAGTPEEPCVDESFAQCTPTQCPNCP